MSDTAIAIRAGMPAMELSNAVERYKLLNTFIKQVLRDGIDFGVIPGTGDKPVLLKPGAEKLTTFFGLAPTFEHMRVIEDWTGEAHGGEPFFYYLVKCRFIRGGEVVAEGDGSCNSRESKYRYRQGERVCPHCGMAAIIKGKDEYEKNPQYKGGWLCFGKKGGCGAKFVKDDPEITGQQTGRIVNPDIADQVNTILKVAEKRALIAATLIGVNASDYFTQDMEDLPMYGDVVDVPVRVVAQPRQDAPASEPPPDTMDAEFERIPTAQQERAAQPNGKPPAPKSQRLAELRTGLYADRATKFAGEFAAYRGKDGKPDHGHIRGGLLALGFEDITNDNLDAAFQKLAEHALSKEADAASAA